MLMYTATLAYVCLLLFSLDVLVICMITLILDVSSLFLRVIYSPDHVQLDQPAPYRALSPDVTVQLARHPAAVPFSFPTNLPPLPPTPPDTPATDGLSALLNSPTPGTLRCFGHCACRSKLVPIQ